MTIFEKLKKTALEKSADMPEEDFILRGIWNIDLYYQPDVSERVFKYDLIVTQTLRQGCCYAANKIEHIDKNWIGKDARKIETGSLDLDIAILDAIYSSMSPRPDEIFEIEGFSFDKAAERAKIVVGEVEKVLEGRKGRILNIGVIGKILSVLKKNGHEVYATDLDQEIIGKRIGDVLIENGMEKNEELIAGSDLILITGMTLASNSLERILELARESGTKVVMFNETGCWFGKEYCDSFGVDSVIGESFPFYIYEGKSKIQIFRKSGGFSE